MFFPIRDDDKDVNIFPYVTNGILTLNVLVFLLQMSSQEFTYGWSVIPYELTHGIDLIVPQAVEIDGYGEVEIPQAAGPPIIWLTLFSSMFMHGGFGHIAGNMLYLWIFGNNVEHRFGHKWFFVFYITAGIAASLAQISVSPNSIVPNLGASGAIAGVMGAYLVLFPHNRVNVVFLYSIITVPAIVVLGMWILTQFVSGIGSIAATSTAAGGVAYMAHIGGFLTGVTVGMIGRQLFGTEPDSVLFRQYERDARDYRIW
ncbi:MAG: rhomboid family intramembrane serine protease [Planctomycetales bacterium]|nr:rhomboid family intramembrane serine protease [Planctomycetales bacterium]